MTLRKKRLHASALLVALVGLLLITAGCDNPVRTRAQPVDDPTPSDNWPDDVTWTHVWGDEFDYQGALNGSKWTFETGGGGWGNQELQYYTDRRENTRVDGDHLIIEARRESYGGNQYTSARINSAASWTYGRFEIRARLPEGLGTWPALWMLASQDTYGDAYWPDNGEIDIMEHVGYDPGIVHATVHTEAYNHADGTEVGASKQVPDATDAFNVYAIEWTPDEIRAYVNGEQYFSFANERQVSSSATYEEWPFDKPFHLLMNIAVGGTWGGAQGVNPDAFPATMAIDYVRVYQPESLVND
ncbi:glycoside hydrolase family 16 protein [Salisaeta longa]|uniref:glycoside hydrolase family 16 protein n=1 Tax=Salisaeta longa TaxID=503170 RepID=UPI000406B9E6|nr:glycoside hydrolase family 16 protein [Salisaeta longa]